MSVKYWLFVGDQYETGGGMDEFKGVFDTLEEAKQESEEHAKSNWKQRPFGEIVKVENNKPANSWFFASEQPLNKNDVIEWVDNGTY